MSQIFRSLRKLSIDKSKLQNYVMYSIGEILLIVIGILIALALNNKSIEIEKEKTFNSALSQLYTHLYCEYGWYEFILKGLEKQRGIAIKELNGKDTLIGKEVPFTIIYLNSEFMYYKTNSQHLLNQLQENIILNEQNVLVNQINTYYSIWEDWDGETKKKQVKYFDRLLDKYNFPYQPRQDLFNDESVQSVLTFTEEDIEKAINIRKDKDYKNQVQSTINKINDLIFFIDYRLNETKALLEYFDEKKYSLTLNFNNVSIIGSTLSDGWEKSIPMKLVDKEKAIWKIKIEVQDGKLKFRNGNSWNQNWGGTELFNGDVLFFGTHIPVKKGYYEIKLNIVDKKYTIKKITGANNS